MSYKCCYISAWVSNLQLVKRIFHVQSRKIFCVDQSRQKVVHDWQGMIFSHYSNVSTTHIYAQPKIAVIFDDWDQWWNPFTCTLQFFNDVQFQKLL